MADWGLLAGLGEAMKGFGNAWSDRKAAELKEKLAQEREVRKEELANAKEERLRKQEEATPVKHKIERDSDGATWRVPYNKFDQPLGERVLASAQDIKDYNYEEQTRKLSLDKLVGDDKRAQEKHEADMEYRGALTEAADARAYRSMNPVPRTGGSGRTSLDAVDKVNRPDSESDLARDMIKEYPDLFKDTGLTPQETFDYALESIRIADKQGKDPVLVVRRAIQKYLDRKKKNASSGKPGVVKLNNQPR